WGRRNGQLVWDKETVSTATSGSDGAFRFDVDGGFSLRVQARGYPEVRTSFCPRDTLVLVGGPYPELAADRRLVFADALGGDDADRVKPPALARDLGLTASGPAFGENGSRLRIDARGGIVFVPGTGAIPAPPPLPYPPAVEIDFNRDCGWLFVGDGAAAVAVVDARPPSGSQDPGGPWVWSMLYIPLPGHSAPGS
ncbi:MAG TPA: hypothetical protein VFK50_09645, partial [Sphingomicrobium sp.]|nr:hypothetical protein [Sphingomicrobium sp.]